VTWQWTSVIPVWILSIIGALLVAALSPSGEVFTWMPIVFAGCVLVTFAIQLGTQRKEGFVSRVMMSIVGSIVVLAVASGLLALFGG